MVISAWCAILVAVLVTRMVRRLALAGWVGALLVVIACGL